jgi:hypothetical protein
MDYFSVWDSIWAFITAYTILVIVISLLPMIVMGIFTAKLAHKKGYRGYFFTGFFFNLIGLIYVVGLPLARDCCGKTSAVPEPAPTVET